MEKDYPIKIINNLLSILFDALSDSKEKQYSKIKTSDLQKTISELGRIQGYFDFLEQELNKKTLNK